MFCVVGTAAALTESKNRDLAPYRKQIMLQNKWILSSFLLLSTGACADMADDSGTERVRQNTDKADIEYWGSCGTGCGGPSEYGNCWCDESCAANGDCCSDTYDTCDMELPVPSDSDDGFVSFRYFVSGGKPGPDTYGSIEVFADGKMIVDKFNDTTFNIYTVQLSQTALGVIKNTLLYSDLRQMMSENQCPVGAASLREDMLLQTTDAGYTENTSQCRWGGVQDARNVINYFARSYVP